MTTSDESRSLSGFETHLESSQLDSNAHQSTHSLSYTTQVEVKGNDSINWVPIPPSLNNRFKFVKTLKRGGEATLYLVKEVGGNDELLILKLYHRESNVDETVMNKLKSISESETDNPSVVRLIDWGVTNDTEQRYEIQEYLDVGDLYDFVASKGQVLEGRKIIPQDSQIAFMIVSELFLAIKTVHAAGLSHHDIKPSNILVKKTSPQLDLVLADFGLAVDANYTIFQSKIMATIAYQSPESIGAGRGGPKRDYWAMGMTIAEILTGCHPFADPHQPDTLLSEAAIKDHLWNKRPIDMSGINSKRYRLLCEGLTLYSENNRWGETQVGAWLEGKNPEIIPDSKEPENSTQTIGRISFAGKLVGSREELAAIMSDEWRASAGILNSEESRSKFLDQIASVFGSEGIEELESQWRKDKPGIDRAVADLICTLDPKQSMPTFRGYLVDQKNLASLARSVASGDDKASRAVQSLFNHEGLLPYSKLGGQSNLENIDKQWHEAVTKFDTIIKEAAINSIKIDFPRPVALATLLGAISDETFAATIENDRNEAINQNPESKNFKWFDDLCKVNKNDVASLLALRILAKPADSAFREKRAIEEKKSEAERAQIEKEQQRTRLTVRRDALLKHVDRLPDTYLSVGGFIGGSIFLSLFLWIIVGSILWGINVYRPAHESAYFWPSFIGGPVLMAVFAIIRALAVRRSDYLQDQMTSLDRQMEELDGKRLQTEVISTKRAKILCEVEEKRRIYLGLKNIYGENSSPARKAKKEWDRLRKKI
jgi:serine/threonine protein kinase